MMSVSGDEFPNKIFNRTIFVPDHIIDAIRDKCDMRAGYQLARALTAKYEKHPTNPGHFYRYMDKHKFAVHLDEKDKAMGEIIDDFLLHGEYEPETVKIVKENVKEGDVCVDVGASHGFFTLLFASLVGTDGRVYSIEPTSNQFKYLQENIDVNGYKNRVSAYNYGASSKEDFNATLKVNLGHQGNLHTIALDSILPEKVDFIKMDIDGTEPLALKGLEETIKRNPQLKMIIEYYPEYVKKLGNSMEDFDNFLEKYFTFERIGGDFENEAYWNYFCIRK